MLWSSLVLDSQDCLAMHFRAWLCQGNFEHETSKSIYENTLKPEFIYSHRNSIKRHFIKLKEDTSVAALASPSAWTIFCCRSCAALSTKNAALCASCWAVNDTLHSVYLANFDGIAACRRLSHIFPYQLVWLPRLQHTLFQSSNQSKKSGEIITSAQYIRYNSGPKWEISFLYWWISYR